MQHLRDPAIRPRRPAKPQIDPAGIERVERAELLGDHEWVVIGQHDPARTDPDLACSGADTGEHHGSRAASNARHAVMLGDPISAVAKRFGLARQSSGGSHRFANSAAFTNRNQIENGEGDHRPAFSEGAATAATGAGPSCAR